MTEPTGEPHSVEEFLQTRDAHDKWIAAYRGPENEAFYALAFDHAMRIMGMRAGDTLHDFGCGSAKHSIRFAQRGLRVEAFDLSASVLQLAEEAVAALDLSDRINLRQGDLTKLPIDAASARFGLCWGVLMHIPEVEKAVAELGRVMAPGGILLVSEANMHAVTTASVRAAKVLLKRGVPPQRTPAGVEYWTTQEAGQLVTRQADVGWLRSAFAQHGLRLIHRHSGEFSELYNLFDRAWLRSLVHGFNRAWFRFVPVPQLAYGNMLFFRKAD